VLGALSLGVNRLGLKADHSSPSGAKVKEGVELYLHSPNISSWRGAYLSTETTLPLTFHVPNLITFYNKLIFYGEEELAPHPNSMLEDHPLSTARDYLFSIFPATLHIWRPSPPSAT
jgi:hypothetical protein